MLRRGDSAEARLLLGTVKLDALDFEGAIADLKRASELNPQLPELHSYLGRSYQTGDTAAARLAFQKELELNPNDFESNLQLGAVHLAASQLEDARTVLERVLKGTPHFIHAHILLATVYYRLGRRADGDSEKALAQKLTMEEGARQRGEIKN